MISLRDADQHLNLSSFFQNMSKSDWNMLDTLLAKAHQLSRRFRKHLTWRSLLAITSTENYSRWQHWLERDRRSRRPKTRLLDWWRFLRYATTSVVAALSRSSAAINDQIDSKHRRTCRLCFFSFCIIMRSKLRKQWYLYVKINYSKIFSLFRFRILGIILLSVCFKRLCAKVFVFNIPLEPF